MTAHAPPAPHYPPTVGLLAVGLILTPFLVRATSGLTTLPYWDFDPLVVPPTMTGLGPAASMAMDALALAGAALGLWHAHRVDRASPANAPRPLVFLAIFAVVLLGCVPIAYHGWLREAPYLQHQRIGSAWAASALAALALWRLGRDPRLRAAALATLLGFVVLLALKGAAQVLIEHPATVADFQRSKERIFAASGWTPDSAMARAYERRLMQNEATGWFGLSNVYASFTAFGTLAWTGLAIAAWSFASRARSPALARAGLVLPPLAAALALALAQSKGGFGALLMGVLAWTAWAFIARRASASRPSICLLTPALVALTLAGVIVRGLIGERLGELSILFRWFYIQAASRIATGFDGPAIPGDPLGPAHVGSPWLGVGPDGFKDAYLVAKNPLSPEEVASPHSILFDWWACLGSWGLLWVGVFIVALVLIGTRALRPAPPHPPASTPAPSDQPPMPAPQSGNGDPDRRALLRAVCGIAAATILGCLLAARGAIDETAAAVAILGLIAWCLAGALALPPLLGNALPARLSLAAAAAALAVHGQIEVTGSHPSSCGLFLALLALAATGPARTDDTAPHHAADPPPAHAGPSRFASLAPPALVALAAAGLVFLGVIPAWRWERALRDAAERVAVLGRVHQSLRDAATLSPRDRQDLLDALAADVSTETGSPVTPTPAGLQQALAGLEAARLEEAHATITSVASPYDWRTARETSRLALRLVALAGPDRRSASFWADRALIYPPDWEPTSRLVPERLPGLANIHAWNARAGQELHALRASPDDSLAVETLRQSLRLDPYNVLTWMNLAEAFADAGQSADAARAARRALEVNALLRLDPLKQLDDRQRARIERLAASAAQPPP